MSSLTVSDISEITRQADVLSKPLRDNFTNIRAAVNDNQTQINSLSTAATNAETTQARPNHASLNTRLNSINLGQANYIKSGGLVSAQAVPDMTVLVSAGEANVNGIDIAWDAVTSETLAAPTSITTGGTIRYDLVVLNAAQTTGGSFVEIVSGAEGDSPVYPTITDNQKVLAILEMNSGMTTITASDITDARDQGCWFLAAGRWQYEWMIQDAIDAVTNGGTIFVGTGTYYEDLTFANNQIVFFMGQASINNAAGDTVNLDTLDLSYLTNAKLIWPAGENSSDVEDYAYLRQTGSDLNLAGTGNVSVTALSGSRIAFLDSGQDDLRTYDFDGLTWSQTGNDLNIAGITNPTITALSSTRVALADAGLDQLIAYSWDGTDWVQYGNVLGLTAFNATSGLTALSSTRVAFIGNVELELRTYDFDGTNWSLTGNGLAIAGAGTPTVTALTSSRVALFDLGNDELRTYDFDGTDWTLTGNGLTITNGAANSANLVALRANQVAFLDSDNDELRVYRFDGTDWSLVGAYLSVANAGASGLTALSSTRLAYIDPVEEDLRTYDLVVNKSVYPPSPAFD